MIVSEKSIGRNETAFSYEKQHCESIYGKIPPRPIHLSYKIECHNPCFAAGKADKIKYELMLDFGEKEAILPVTAIIPKGDGRHPVIINFSTETEAPNKFLPAEDLTDRGYTVFSLFMKDVSDGNGDFKSGISKYIAKSRRKKSSAGKLAVWAWAILRVVEFVCDLIYVDTDAVAIAGHGICARAVMLAGGLDERIKFVIANGIATLPFPYSDKRAKSGITVHDYPYLYCPAFADDPSGDEYESLLRSCASKYILIGSAADGIGLDTDEEYEYISSLSSSDHQSCESREITEKNNILTDRVQTCGENISYHIRPGVDYFSREDWNIYLDFIDRKIKQK